MRLLLDTCLSGKTADILRASGHDVVWTGSWSADPGDVAILARARDEQRILVTLDKDKISVNWQLFAASRTAALSGW